MSCCTTYTKLGCFNSCEAVNTGILASAAGDYILLLEFNGGETSIPYTMDEDEEFVIDTPLNENYIYSFRIFDEDGELVGCYRFETVLTKTL